jgi:hypothetical protein
MAGNAFPADENLYDRGGDTQVGELAHEVVGHTVKAIVIADVVVDIHAGLLPQSEFPSPCWQWTHGRPIDGLERGSPTAFQFLERPVVESHEQLRDRGVEFLQAEKRAIA